MTEAHRTEAPHTRSVVSLDPRDAFRTASALAATVMDAVSPSDTAKATPCTGMDVAAVCEHLVMAVRRLACAGRRDPVQTWPEDARDVAAGAWPAALRTAATEAQEAWSDASKLDEQIELPWATVSGAGAVGIYVNEVCVHTWDLAVATGQRPAWEDDTLAVAYAAITDQLPMPERGPLWEAARQQVPPGAPWADPFADAEPVADDAPLIDRLVAWNGRRPGR